MQHHIDIQHASTEQLPVSDEMMIMWSNAVLKNHPSSELTIRIVTADDMQLLNRTYRQQDKTTNVLAFPSNLPADVSLEYKLLGDIIICPVVLKAESQTLDKPLEAHWAHIIIHGILHLLGHDHVGDEDTKLMQDLEVSLLTELNYEDPYSLDS